MGRPSVFPTGTTMYDPARCHNGYTLFPAAGKGAVLIDMNGKIVHFWKEFQGFPNKMIPGGHVFGSLGLRDRDAAYQDYEDLTEVDWDGNVEWTFTHNEHVNDPDTGERWVARMHHDYQIEGNPVGYAAPGLDFNPDFDKVLILTHHDVDKPKISPQVILEDRVIEVNRKGELLWEWHMMDHFNELGISEAQKNVMYRDPNTVIGGPNGEGDIFHVNCASYLGPNHWFDEGDERFAPENVIMDSREANIMWIVSRKTGKIVWRVGPDYRASRELRIMGEIIGMHHTHMIPAGLPGAGNIMVFDNGGWAGYGLPSQTSRFGMKTDRRDYSRVVEFDPTTLKVVWEYDPSTYLGYGCVFHEHYFYSPLVSSAQRLENGNTLITEGCSCRLLEVDSKGELVWEYVYPHTGRQLIYRAYRIPYEWVPQLEKPQEVAIEPPSNLDFQLEGTFGADFESSAVSVDGTKGYTKGAAFCVDTVE